MGKRRNPAYGLDKRVLPNLALHQLVKVVKGKYAGREGRAVFARREEIAVGKDNIRLTIACDGNESIIVDMEDIKGKYDTLDITLFMGDDERVAFEARVKELKEGGYDST